MKEWPLQPPDSVLINNLGFALLRRISSDPPIYKAAEIVNADADVIANANAKRDVEGISSIWELICRRDFAPDCAFPTSALPWGFIYQADFPFCLLVELLQSILQSS